MWFVGCARGFVCVARSTTPTVVTSPVGCPSALLVGGTDTGCRHWSPASPFQCLTLGCSVQRP
ncbi:hypothetical protein Taro_039620 [Colocasia esculenta]|uniref:Secreted protein n=1 Tax=Colocasia esculenta TaxID=4460 RepID=A0A843WW87_COLES|nr:hypothetical protein [Colocasia esculenta]